MDGYSFLVKIGFYTKKSHEYIRFLLFSCYICFKQLSAMYHVVLHAILSKEGSLVFARELFSVLYRLGRLEKALENLYDWKMNYEKTPNELLKLGDEWHDLHGVMPPKSKNCMSRNIFNIILTNKNTWKIIFSVFLFGCFCPFFREIKRNDCNSILQCFK